jgi:dienelactone hydrolase
VITQDVVEVVRDGRALPTFLHLPGGDEPWPLVVFAHGWMGHPRKFTRLFERWSAAGIAVAAPSFPNTNETSSGKEFDDVANQPADLRHVLEHVRADRRFDGDRAVLGGFSLGAATALGAAFEQALPVAEVRGVVAISGALPWFAPFELRPCPLLVVHGRHDDVVPYEKGLAVYRRALPPKALLTIELPGHDQYVQDEPPSAADETVADVTAAFLESVLLDRDMPRPDADPSLGRLESEGLW